MALRSATQPFFLILRFQLRVFELTDVHQRSKVDLLFLSLCLQNKLLFALHIGQLPRWQLFDLLPSFVHCCFRIWIFLTLEA